MSPIFVSAAAFVSVALLLLWVWQRPAYTVSAKELLHRAVMSEQANPVEAAGVRYSKVRIHSSRFNVEHELYHDNQGQRHRRPEVSHEVPEEIEGRLSLAGVDWDAPLSAGSYLAWHDSQPSVSDSISERGGLLTLVTRSGGGEIPQQSITVRASDFHTVERRIEVRSYGTIEIAELNYAVLGWNGVNGAFFEPLEVPHSLTPSIRSMAPALPSSPTDAELDSADLGVRLALNRLHADEGEPISIVRTVHQIEVEGVVDTSQRKQEIVGALNLVPYVKADVLSTTDVRSTRLKAAMPQTTRVELIDPAASPLETYLTFQHEEKLLLDGAPQTLVDEAQKIARNADELNAVARYSVATRSSLQETTITLLSRNYQDRLLMAVDSEASALRHLGFSETGRVHSSAMQINLIDESQRNNALCLELVSAISGDSRSAPEVVADIRASIERIRTAIAARDGFDGRAQSQEIRSAPH